MKTPKIVEVEWIDITSYSAWNNLEDAKKLPPTSIVSVGYFVNKDKHSIRIAQSVSSDMGYANTKVIPLKTVKRIRRVR